jgi:hypothetical protein
MKQIQSAQDAPIVSSVEHQKLGGLMAIDEDYLKHLLELEYEHSVRAIDKFDEYRARLKGWMITASAGVAAVGFSVRSPEIFWAGGLMIFFFALSELYYIDIQEDASRRSRELEKLIDQLLRTGIKPEHHAYEFGLGKVFGGGRMPEMKELKSWILYRTFNPVLYCGILGLMIAAAIAL